MITQSLDHLAYGTMPTRPNDDFLRQCMVIDQKNSITTENVKSLLKSQTTMGVVAIVDRTADVAAAARTIAMSTILFGGKGPYAPSCILVNEFVEKKFSQLYEDYASTTTKSSLNGVNGELGAGKKDALNGGLHKSLPLLRSNGPPTLINRYVLSVCASAEL